MFTDFTNDYVATLLGPQAAQAVVIAVKLPVIYMLVITYVERLLYTHSCCRRDTLVTSRYVLKNWGVRECASEVLFDSESLKLPLYKFYGITYGVLAVVYSLAVVLPSVFVVMLFVGSTACVCFSYIFPGLLMTVEGGQLGKRRRIEGYVFLVLGVLFSVLGLMRAVRQAMAN